MIGTRSFVGSYARLLNMLVATTMAASPDRTSVYPSAAERASLVTPIVPELPGIFSRTTGCFQTSLSFSAIRRATESVPDPATNGTIRRTSRVGQAGCAIAAVAIWMGSDTAASRTLVVLVQYT